MVPQRGKEKREELDLTHLNDSDEEAPQTKRRKAEDVRTGWGSTSAGGSMAKGAVWEEREAPSGNNFETRSDGYASSGDDTDAEEEEVKPVEDMRYYEGTIKTISYATTTTSPPPSSSAQGIAATSHGCITFEGMIGPTSRSLQRVLVLSFDFSFRAFLDKIPDHVPLLCVTQHEPISLSKVQRDRGNVYWFEAPGANAFCSQHSKSLVLYYENSVRIVIGTANFSADISTIRNLCYIHDFPRLSQPFASRALNTTIFPDGLIHSFDLFLKNGVGLYPNFPEFTEPLTTKFDFSALGKDADVVLVWSIKSTSRAELKLSEESSLKLGGMASLARAVRKLRRFEGGSYKIELSGSSVNKSPRGFFKSLLAACSGISPTPENFAEQVDVLDTSNIKLVYPTDAHERQYGLRARYNATPIEEIYKVQYDREDKSREDPRYKEARRLTENEIDIAPRLLHTLINPSGSPPQLVHAKTILILHTPDDASCDTPEGFLYLGSHNSTQAAWGRTSYDPTILADPARARRPYCNQAELGVLVRLAGNTLAEIEACAEKFLPYQRPLVRFGKGDKLYIPPKAKILRGKGHSDSEGDAVRVERVGAYTSM